MTDKDLQAWIDRLKAENARLGRQPDRRVLSMKVSQKGALSVHGLGRFPPLLEGKVARGSKATAYVCENRLCDLPTTDPSVFATQIRTVHQLDQ